MAKTTYHPEYKAVLDSFLLGLPGVTTGIVFGLPCYKVNNTVFATLCGEGVGLKLPEAQVRELLEKPGFVPFQPFGRNRGREFVQINHQDAQDYLHDKELFIESIAYVSSSSADKKDELSRVQPPVGDDEELFFRSIVEALAKENSGVTFGKMMSSPGIKYRDKVFAFYPKNIMVFKLGRNFKPEVFGIQHYGLLAPFKTRPPMAD